MALTRFGPFTFDPDSGELRRMGRVVRLRPQPARVLAVLTERAGDLIPRAELRRLVWGDEVHVNFNLGINSCVRQIRSALRDGRGTIYVETLPKRGYRFVQDVRVAGGSGSRSGRQPQAAGAPPGVDGPLVTTPRRPSRLEAAIHAAVLSALGVAWSAAAAGGAPPPGIDLPGPHPARRRSARPSGA